MSSRRMRKITGGENLIQNIAQNDLDRAVQISNERSIQSALQSSLQKDGDHIYYNIVINNNTTTAIPATFVDNRSEAIIKNPQEYELAVIRFLIPGSTIPIFLLNATEFLQPSSAVVNTALSTTVASTVPFAINLVGQTITGAGIPVSTTVVRYLTANTIQISNAATAVATGVTVNFTPAANTTFYSVTLSYLGNDFQTYIVFVPTTSVTTTENLFGVFAYDNWLAMINTAFATSFAALKAAFPAAAPTQPPRLIYNTEDKLISLYVQNTYDSTNANRIEVFMNIPLFEFFESFAGFFFGYNQLNGKDVRYTINQTDSIYIPTTQTLNLPSVIALNTASGPFYQIRQEYQTLYLWNSLRSLVITTSLIPVRNEYIPAQNVQGNASNLNNNNLAVLTDFEPILYDGPEVRSYYQYYPQGPYRYIDLKGNQPLYNFDIQVYWQDFNGNLHQLQLDPFYNLTIKMIFKKKSLGDQTYSS